MHVAHGDEGFNDLCEGDLLALLERQDAIGKVGEDGKIPLPNFARNDRAGDVFTFHGKQIISQRIRDNFAVLVFRGMKLT